MQLQGVWKSTRSWHFQHQLTLLFDVRFKTLKHLLTFASVRNGWKRWASLVRPERFVLRHFLSCLVNAMGAGELGRP